MARNEGTGLLDKDLAATINRICEGNRNLDVCTDSADTQVIKCNCLTDTPLQSHDRLVPQDGYQVDEGSIVQSLQNAGSSVFTSDNILLSSFSSSGNSMPSDLAFSQISGHQVPFVKRSPAWRLMDVMDVFKEVPQQPHFHPLRQYLPALREEMALGLLVTFASSVEDIRKSSIGDSTASLQEKIATLRHLEENGFSVQFLRSRLIKLLRIKSDHSNYIAEKEHLKALLLEKTTSLSQIDERLEKKEQTIAELEEELGRARWEAQKIMEEKECEDEELSRLKAADRSVEEACGVAELQFQSVLAELRHRRLT